MVCHSKSTRASVGSFFGRMRRPSVAAKPISTHDLVVGLKGAFPELAERLDGDRVDGLCRELVGRGELREV